ncbi:MAG: hypothetical protein WC533_02775 [Candidatus Pacearchaeota archaeon]
MTSTFDEIHDRLRDSYLLKSITEEIAKVLRKFETAREGESIVVYDQEQDGSYRSGHFERYPRTFFFFNTLGLLDNVGKPYDWEKYVLNKRAREVYEQLKREGYYSESPEQPELHFS